MAITQTDNPIELFRLWFAEAERSETSDANAVALATATPDGAPSVRMVLLKGVDERGFVFYTNLDSRKAGELYANPRAALCFHWKSLRRQVRVEGAITQVDDPEADAYFASRHRTSRIGAWASKQSQPMEGRFELEKRVAAFAAKFHVGEIPRPANWSGFRLAPQKIEFWTEQAFRLHDRILYNRDPGGWTAQRLFP